MQELFVPGIMLMILIGIAFVTGRLAEAAHERALRRDEQLLPNQHLSTEDHAPKTSFCVTAEWSPARL